MLGAGLGAALLKVGDVAREKPELAERRVTATNQTPVATPANPEPVASAGGVPFSRRERQVLEQVAAGATSAEIAERLHISIHTVKNHRKSILRKAGCRNSGQLVSRCAALGLL
ncbi:helix-turn-helix transcriptional regulator [Microbulbifer elongatus]|uniref:Helix-turn-helix transcriptional regulator n=1 Tax=Microbulbifer elongatus TaxID=86173 RepID=A0ABT1NVW9_9GAMM|nr:helix-turn-helix transcriptional regulator [Microbulbifer elongatus]MCQ3828042.1 helix-turn-helix transcriptional regulator [Microbulbifer elongatus]